ncbi:MAG: hypothetical protein U1G08_12410 [Verrucomicrobiota bacterium]
MIPGFLPHQYQPVAVSLAATFWELLRVPFQHADLVWGIVPLYFSWMVSELTAAKATYNTALQTGFALLWSGAHWIWQVVPTTPVHRGTPPPFALVSLNTLVTLVVVILGALALWSGIRRRYPRGMWFLGHTRFAGYFMITLFPIQAGRLSWTGERVAAIALFAVPVWLLLHVALHPFRKR